MQWWSDFTLWLELFYCRMTTPTYIVFPEWVGWLTVFALCGIAGFIIGRFLVGPVCGAILDLSERIAWYPGRWYHQARRWYFSKYRPLPEARAGAEESAPAEKREPPAGQALQRDATTAPGVFGQGPIVERRRNNGK